MVKWVNYIYGEQIQDEWTRANESDTLNMVGGGGGLFNSY